MKRTLATSSFARGRRAADGRTRRDPLPAGRGGCRAEGTVLIVTMWIMLVLAGLVIVLARSMRVEAVCAANYAAAQQASAVEQGAIQYVLASLDGLQGLTPSEADMPCQAVQVGYGAFWILRPNFEDDREWAYGVVGEAAKVDLNSAPAETLLRLTDMTDELAAAVVDWRDADSDLTPGGGESEYYLLLGDPYECKNAPLETVEELLLVKGCSRELLFGEDLNRNGVLDDNENDGSDSDPTDDRDGKLDRGIFDFVTVHAVEPNTSAAGSQRVNVNQAQTQALSQVLQKSVALDRLPDVLDRARRGRPFQSVLDFYFRTGLTMKEFAPIADQLTTVNDRTLRGLINVNTAPKEVLLCLPGLDEGDVSALLAGRSGEEADLNSIAWVAQALPREKAVPIGPHITARSFQFSADIVSISGDGRAFKRCRNVVDAAESPPRLIYRQDLTHLGWPLPPEIVDQLRSGTGMQEVVQNVAQGR
jgi:type II secretory pathway component PulK